MVFADAITAAAVRNTAESNVHLLSSASEHTPGVVGLFVKMRAKKSCCNQLENTGWFLCEPKKVNVKVNEL